MHDKMLFVICIILAFLVVVLAAFDVISPSFAAFMLTYITIVLVAFRSNEDDDDHLIR